MLMVLEIANKLVWGIPALLLIIGVGAYLTWRTGFAQLRLFPCAISRFWKQLVNQDGNGKKSYQALCTALAATVGTGNVAGVAGAIALGGPGAIFWMWLCAFFGMITKYAEATLAVRYRQKNIEGETVGGPMYMIQKGMPERWRWMAGVYSFFGVVAAFGVGNATQINAVIGSFHSVSDYFGCIWKPGTDLLLGSALAVLILMMLLGGAKRIGKIAEGLVPFAAGGYMLLCAVVLLFRCRALPCALQSIFCGAFSPKAVTGGILGSVLISLRVGASRGVFTNEAGMGTAAIAHGASDVDHPAEQGLMGIIEVFLDTILICTLTALVILCSGTEIPYGTDPGIKLTVNAFSDVLGSWVSFPIAIFICCFAIATVLGWGLYGIRCAQYLFGVKAWRFFVYLQGVVVIVSSLLGTGTVWRLAETVNGLMAIPNLMVLAYLAPELKRLTDVFCCRKSVNCRLIDRN